MQVDQQRVSFASIRRTLSCRRSRWRHSMRNAISQQHVPSAAPKSLPKYLTNDEAAGFLRLSPRTLEKQRVIGGGPRFRKFGRRSEERRVGKECGAGGARDSETR